MKAVKKWILIAEDDAELRDLYDSFLNLNYGDSVKVISTGDGLEATQKLPFQAFDLIITDLNMPRKTGQAFIKAIESSQMNSETPLVVISGMAQGNLKSPHLTFVEKPIDQATFTSIVDNQLKLGRTDQRVAADLLNAFITVGNKFLDQTLNESIEQLKPNPKKAGETLKGEYTKLFEVKMGKTTNSFAFSFDKQLLSEIAQKSKLDDSQLEHIFNAANNILVKHAISKMTQLEVNITLQATASKGSEEEKTISRKRGIEIPLQTKVGALYMYALWK